MSYTTAAAIVDLLKMTEEDVSDIETENNTTIEEWFEPFIEAANSIIVDVCLESDYTDSKLEIIERYLATHFYKVPRPDAKTEMVRGLSSTYDGQTRLAFDFTRWGQMAKLLDTAGNLAQLQEEQEGKKPRITGAAWHVGGGGDCRGEEEVEEVG
jgi:hypothetical protein